MSEHVRPKKYLGQHFLKDQNIAKKIVNALTFHQKYNNLLEIGPGTGILTRFLMDIEKINLWLIEIDPESVKYLKDNFTDGKAQILRGDYLKEEMHQYFRGNYGIIGNFPYNISSQIFFKVLDDRDHVEEVVGMLQKEVAERISSPPGNKNYGILSVLLQAYYDIELLFDVPPHVFHPPPKVNSAVIRLLRNQTRQLDCDERLFFRIVKQGFQNRRKTLRNALKAINLPAEIKDQEILSRRAEQLTVSDFVNLTNIFQKALM